MRQPTPLQIARFGHIAAALRELVERRGWSASELGRTVGVAPSGPYVWLHALGAPGPKAQAKLAKLTGLPKETFVPREPDEAGSSVALLARPAVPVPVPVPGARRVGEALSFTINDAGEARIRLDVSMPLAQAMPLVRLLLDAEAVARIGGSG